MIMNLLTHKEQQLVVVVVKYLREPCEHCANTRDPTAMADHGVCLKEPVPSIKALHDFAAVMPLSGHHKTIDRARQWQQFRRHTRAQEKCKVVPGPAFGAHYGHQP